MFHVDGGWNTSLAVNNIEMLVEKLGLELYTEVINWKEMQDLQLSYFKSGIPCLDTPQDHVFFAAMYNYAKKNNIRYIFNGGNYSTECIREPLEWHYHASDLKQLKSIHKIFGTLPLNTLPMSDIFKYKIYYRYFKRMKVIQPLNFIKYNNLTYIDMHANKLLWSKELIKQLKSKNKKQINKKIISQFNNVKIKKDYYYLYKNL